MPITKRKVKKKEPTEKSEASTKSSQSAIQPQVNLKNTNMDQPQEDVLTPEQQTAKQKAITFATSEHYAGAVEILRKARTQLTTIVADDQFHTLLNALTLEIETNLIHRFVVEIEKIRSGQNLFEEK